MNNIAKILILSYSGGIRTHHIGITPIVTFDGSNKCPSDYIKFEEIKKNINNFKPERDLVFHYCLYVNNISICHPRNTSNPNESTTEGIADLYGNNLIISKGFLKNENIKIKDEAGSLMHELGHNLNLCHGGSARGIIQGENQDTINYKPNYLSIMNYAFSSTGVPKPFTNTKNFVIDYSSDEFDLLDEFNLDESIGLSINGVGIINKTKYFANRDGTFIDYGCTTTNGDKVSIDWNANKIINNNLIKANINDCGQETPKFQKLYGCNDWKWIKLDFQKSDVYNKRKRGEKILDFQTETYSIQVAKDVNSNPIAHAGNDTILQKSCASIQFALNGALSEDLDGTYLTYTWKGNFPEGNGVVAGVNPTVTLPIGETKIVLVVNDGWEDSEPDTVKITVPQAVIGEPCNDSNLNTTNDKIQPDCTCRGEIVITYDCPTLQKNINDPCNDNNPNTQNDKIQSNCTCAGTPVTNILTLNCPVNISVIAAIGQISVVVNYTTPTATSTCTIGNITVTPSSTNPASGTAFPIGTKTLSFTVSDGCGNTKTCSFTITVVANSNPCAGDVTKPITKCKTMTVYLNPSGKATISGSDINNGSTDNCSTGLSFAVSPNTFDCSKIGSNTVILTATDAAGNKSTCSTIVNVSDNSAPVFSKCPANISLTTTNSCASATWTNPIVTDNCGTPSVSSNYNSGYCFSIGSKSVVYTATDAKGNKATCNFTVTVTAANTCTNVFSSNKCYKIVNKKSGKLLDVYGALKVNNTPIIQWNANNGANQKWRFISVGSGYVKIVAQNSGKEVACHRTTNNSLVYQYDYASGGAKDWKIECVNNSGYYKITHRLSGKVLDVKNGSSSDGQNIVISNFNANNNSQLWQIVEVTCPTQTYNLASSTIFDINGQAEFDRNRIGFTTNQGFRTDFFTIEKQEKVSGLFEPLEILNNKQVDNNAQYNTVYDNSPYQGDNFYRIKMTYLSGDFEYSAIQKIVNTQKADFVIFPNPASNEAWIDLKSFEGRMIDIALSDIAGKVILYEKVEKAKTIPHRLDLSNVQNGSYTLTIQTSGKRTIVRKLSILK